MDFSLEIDEGGRFVVTLTDEGARALVTSSNLPAADDLAAAVEDARDTGLGECFWEEAGGTYRWMMRHTPASLTVVVLWSTGIVTGWEHVFRGECDIDWFAGRIASELSRHGLASSPR
jgi:hypothetical protein